MTAAELCRERGWGPGDVLRHPIGAVLQITAIGIDIVLDRNAMAEEQDVWWGREKHHSFGFLDYQKIATAPLDSTPPNPEWFQ